MVLKKANWLLFVAVFLIQACSEDNLEKYEGEYSFTSNVTQYYKFPGMYDTIVYSTGTIKELSSTVLEINYTEHITGDTIENLFLPGPVQVKVDKNGKLSPANKNLSAFLSISGQFEGTDKLTMTLEMSSEYYGKLCTTVVKGTRIQK